jgi:hypothetical protein
LRYLLDLYKGDYNLALGVYNAGEGSVARNAGVPPYAETQRYLEHIWQAAQKSSGRTGRISSSRKQRGGRDLSRHSANMHCGRHSPVCFTLMMLACRRYRSPVYRSSDKQLPSAPTNTVHSNWLQPYSSGRRRRAASHNCCTTQSGSARCAARNRRFFQFECRPNYEMSTR